MGERARDVPVMNASRMAVVHHAGRGTLVYTSLWVASALIGVMWRPSYHTPTPIRAPTTTTTTAMPTITAGLHCGPAAWLYPACVSSEELDVCARLLGLEFTLPPAVPTSRCVVAAPAPSAARWLAMASVQEARVTAARHSCRQMLCVGGFAGATLYALYSSPLLRSVAAMAAARWLINSFRASTVSSPL